MHSKTALATLLPRAEFAFTERKEGEGTAEKENALSFKDLTLT